MVDFLSKKHITAIAGNKRKVKAMRLERKTIDVSLKQKNKKHSSLPNPSGALRRGCKLSLETLVAKI